MRVISQGPTNRCVRTVSLPTHMYYFSNIFQKAYASNNCFLYCFRKQLFNKSSDWITEVKLPALLGNNDTPNNQTNRWTDRVKRKQYMWNLALLQVCRDGRKNVRE